MGSGSVLEVATPQSEILQALESLGWTLSANAFRGGKYVAKATNKNSGQSIEREADSPEMALVAVYNHARQSTDLRMRISAWKENWYSQLHEIAQAYAGLDPYDDAAVEYWQALAHENAQHAEEIQRQIRVEFVPEYEPYESPLAMAEDVHKKQHLMVSVADTGHPLWAEQDVINFRLCHDVLGICQSGGGWTWTGANKAAAHHLPLVSPEAQEALFVEVIGRTAYDTVYKGLGARKVGLMSEFLRPIQDQEGTQVHVPRAQTLEQTQEVLR